MAVQNLAAGCPPQPPTESRLHPQDRARLCAGHLGSGRTRHRRKDIIAGLRAAAAGLCADTAMLVVLGVSFALLAADLARLGTRLENPPGQLRFETGLPGEDAPQRAAHVSAVEIEPDAAVQHLWIAFAEAGVCASATALSAREAGVNACRELVCVHRHRARVRLDHLLSMSHGSSSPSKFTLRYAYAIP
jgi:hypothetical protein